VEEKNCIDSRVSRSYPKRRTIMRANARFEIIFRRYTLLLVVPFFIAALHACNSGHKTPEAVKVPPGGVLLKGAGATFPSPLYNRWFQAYQKTHGDTVIAYDAVGSGEGIRRFMGKNVKEEELVDFGASDAAMKDEDMAQVPKGVVLLPVTAGIVVLAYNLPDIEEDLKLSREAYAGIFLGEITKWNDPLIARSNPGVKLPKISIATVVRQDSSGTTYAFTKHLDAISKKWQSHQGPSTLVNWPGNAMRAKGNEGVAGRIQQSIGSIGYVSYEFAHKLGLKLAVLENREGKFVRPTGESSTTALSAVEMPENLRLFIPDPPGRDSYPIVTLSWILLHKSYENPSKARAVHDLFFWCLNDGQEIAPQLGYVRLPPNISGKALQALETLNSGIRR
jgi:phosphate transport system substrate-binding protein